MKNETKYHRGNGECVVPEMKEPVAVVNAPKYLGKDFYDKYSADSKAWREHIASLPVVAQCDPAEPIGWMDGYEERYDYKHPMETEWKSFKEPFDYDGDLDRRIFLVKPVAKKVVPADKGDEPAGNQIFRIYKQMPDCPLKQFLSEWFGKYDDDPLPNNSADQQGELWDEAEDIFDKHTSPTGGGYEADYTDKRDFINELKSKFHLSRISKND